MTRVKLLTTSLLVLLVLVRPVRAQEDAGAEKEKLGYAGYADSDGHDEEYWAATMGGARGRILTLQRELDRLEAAEAALQSEFYAKDDPYQREKTKATWDETLDRRATMRAELEKAENDLAALEQQARRAGALPGWLRETRDQERARDEFENRPPQEGLTVRVDPDELAEANKRADEAIYGKEDEAAESTPDEQTAAESESKEAQEKMTSGDASGGGEAGNEGASFTDDTASGGDEDEGEKPPA